MTALDLFALVVLLVLVIAVVGIWIILGMMPGKIAAKRNHPQADAINVCGWWGVITLGILLPLAFIWAYTKPAGLAKLTTAESETASAGEQKEVLL